MMINSKFGIGQKVRHKLLGFLGVIIDIDVGYSLEAPKIDNFIENKKNFNTSIWYHVIMEDDEGETIHTYLSEDVLTYEVEEEHPDQQNIDELAASIQQQLRTPRSRN
ncbi:MAG: heat shock protein HspQ [Candidatus Dasytiphilus stammeri]